MQDRSYDINVAVALQIAAATIQGERNPAFATITKLCECFCVSILVCALHLHTVDTGQTGFLAVLVVIRCVCPLEQSDVPL